jgi:hypothetical protein
LHFAFCILHFAPEKLTEHFIFKLAIFYCPLDLSSKILSSSSFTTSHLIASHLSSLSPSHLHSSTHGQLTSHSI